MIVVPNVVPNGVHESHRAMAMARAMNAMRVNAERSGSRDLWDGRQATRALKLIRSKCRALSAQVPVFALGPHTSGALALGHILKKLRPERILRG